MRGYFVPIPRGGSTPHHRGHARKGPPPGSLRRHREVGAVRRSLPGVFMGRTGEAGEAA